MADSNAKRLSWQMIIQAGSMNNQLIGSYVGDLTGNPVFGRQTVATGSWQALDKGNLGTIERIAFKNEDATNFVELDTAGDGSNLIGKVVAGDGGVLPLPASITAVYARADTASCVVSFAMTEA